MNLLFIDTETGGLNPSLNSLLQVGMVAYVNGKITNSYEFSIKKENYNVTAFSLKFNGLDLYEDIYKNGINERQAIEDILDFIANNFKDPPILVGHNPSIDKYMIRELFNRCELDMDKYISHRMIDTMSLLWGLYFAGKIPIEACSSDGAFDYFDIKINNRHKALEDCLATVKLFEKCIDRINENKVS